MPTHRTPLLACALGWFAILLAPDVSTCASLDLAIRDYGIGLGDSRVIHGIRVNLRDRDLERVDGLNLTLWSPADLSDVHVNGLGLGLVAPAATTMRGVFVRGLGVGSERSSGILVGGLGVGGEVVRGVAVGGLGVGAEDFHGIGLGGVGVGGETARGLMIGGFGVGGEDVHGVAVGGFGVGARRMRGFAMGSYCRFKGELRGASVAILNIAHSLHGVQFGLLNWAGNNRRFRLLPLLNVYRGA